MPDALAEVEKLRVKHDVVVERHVADFIDDSFVGFGPKQARNLLQCLGLSQYEICIDSRMTNWLNEFGFPFPIALDSLANRNYYALVMQGVQMLCAASGVTPCVFDAAVFVSADEDDFTPEMAERVF